VEWVKETCLIWDVDALTGRGTFGVFGRLKSNVTHDTWDFVQKNGRADLNDLYVVMTCFCAGWLVGV